MTCGVTRVAFSREVTRVRVLLCPAECNIQTSPSPGIHVRHVYTPSTAKHFSPIKQSTTLTNKHRGNEVSSTPLLVHCECHVGCTRRGSCK